jgi:hypothetical protein
MQVDTFWSLVFGTLDLFRIWSLGFIACQGMSNAAERF